MIFSNANASLNVIEIIELETELTSSLVSRFVVEGSVEERILQLQEKKLALANDVLTGAKRSGANKLSFDDLKMLFQVG